VQLAGQFAAERDRWLLWLPVLLGGGIGLYFLLPTEPSVGSGPVFLGGLAVAAIRFRQNKTVFILCIALAAIAAGFTAAQLRAHQVAAPVLPLRIGPTDVAGTVASVELREGGGRLILEDLSVRDLGPQSTPARVRIAVRTKEELPEPGDEVAVRAMLMPPPRPVAPGAYDFSRDLFFRGIGAVGYGMGTPKVILHAQPSFGETWLASLRQRITLRILDALTPPEAGVAAALLTGQRGHIPEDDMVAVRSAGLAHLLAISGLHVGLVAGILFFVFRAALALNERLALDHPIKKWAAVAALLGSLGYMLLTGATIPTQRAFLMLFLVLSAVLLDRTAITMRLVAWAALVVLLLRPESMLGASFQLSFAAVVALIAVYETWRVGRSNGDRGKVRRLFGYVTGVGLTTLIASAAIAPLAAYHFNRLPVYDLLGNLVAVPVASLWVMPWGLAALALMPLGLEQLALIPMSWGIAAILWTAHAVASLPGAVLLVRSAPGWGLPLFAVGLLWLCLWRQRWRWWGIPVLIAALLTPMMERPPDVLADESADLFAVRGADGSLGLSTTSRNRFTAEAWLRRMGQDHAWGWRSDEALSQGMACDGLGCIIHLDGLEVAMVGDPRAYAEDCLSADLLVSAEPLGDACPHPRATIDRFDLWRYGSHAVWLTGNGIKVKTVDGHRGDRPWVVPPLPRSRLDELQ